MRHALPAALLGLTLLLAIAGCGGQPKQINPPVTLRPTATMAAEEARLHARDLHLDAHQPGEAGRTYRVLDTHSMEPTLRGGDFIVVDTTQRNPQVGQIVTYQADWRPAGADPVTHRVVARDGEGLIVSGDNVRPDIDPATGQDRHSENRYRVTDATLVGVVIAIYRVDPKS